MTTILLRIRSGAPGSDDDRGAYALCEMRLRANAGEGVVSLTRRVGEPDVHHGRPPLRSRPTVSTPAASSCDRQGDSELDLSTGLAHLRAAAPLNDLLRERARDVA